jgi:hypothetical protein
LSPFKLPPIASCSHMYEAYSFCVHIGRTCWLLQVVAVRILVLEKKKVKYDDLQSKVPARPPRIDIPLACFVLGKLCVYFQRFLRWWNCGGLGVVCDMKAVAT